MTKETVTALLDDIGGVVGMLRLHAGIVADVHIVTPRLLASKVVLHTHVHVECLIRFLLAVLDALQLGSILGRHEFHLDAVLVAFLEENFGQRVLLDRVDVVVGVAGPVAVCRHFQLIYQKIFALG